jgi:hypothetical protein
MGQRIRRSVSTLSVRSKQGICWVGAVFRVKPEWRVGQIERMDSMSGRDEEFVLVFSGQINSGSATPFLFPSFSSSIPFSFPYCRKQRSHSSLLLGNP